MFIMKYNNNCYIILSRLQCLKSHAKYEKNTIYSIIKLIIPKYFKGISW